MRLPVAAGVLVALASCAGVVPPGRTVPAQAYQTRTDDSPTRRIPNERAAIPVRAPAPAPARPATSPVVSPPVGFSAAAGPPIASLPITPEQAARARAAFIVSCPALLTRPDRTGLTTPQDWRAPCDAATNGGDARIFFSEYFETARVGDGVAFATGYYEPEIAGSLTRDDAHRVPVYAKPADLVELDLGQFQAALAGKRIGGRNVGGRFVPYHDRAAIVGGVLDGRVPVLAYAADPIEFFFLQVQGSGRLRLPDGQVLRIGYAGQNGRDYVGIGAMMRDRGLIGPGQLSMQGIMAWLRANPDQAPAILNANKSFVFFRTITGAGPIGLLAGQVARALGADVPVLTDLSDFRLARARQLGLRTVRADVALEEEFDVLLECSGAPAAFRTGLAALAPAGRFALVGMGADSVALDVPLVQGRELTITGVFRYADTYPLALRLIASGAVDVDAVITHRFAIEDTEDALTLARRDHESLKAIVHPGGGVSTPVAS